MYSKDNSPVLLINTIFKHWNCFLSFVAMDGNDGHGLKREKVGPTFSSFNAACNIMVSVHGWNLPDLFVHYSTGHILCKE